MQFALFESDPMRCQRDYPAGTDAAILRGMKTEDLRENWDYIRSELKSKYAHLSEEDLNLPDSDCADEALGCLAQKLGKDKEDLRQEIALRFAGDEEHATVS